MKTSINHEHFSTRKRHTRNHGNRHKTIRRGVRHHRRRVDRHGWPMVCQLEDVAQDLDPALLGRRGGCRPGQPQRDAAVPRGLSRVDARQRRRRRLCLYRALLVLHCALYPRLCAHPGRRLRLSRCRRPGTSPPSPPLHPTAHTHTQLSVGRRLPGDCGGAVRRGPGRLDCVCVGPLCVPREGGGVQGQGREVRHHRQGGGGPGPQGDHPAAPVARHPLLGLQLCVCVCALYTCALCDCACQISWV